jgi:hypothetical protein
MRTAVGIAAVIVTVTSFAYAMMVLNLYKLTGQIHWNVFADPSLLVRIVVLNVIVIAVWWFLEPYWRRWRSNGSN